MRTETETGTSPAISVARLNGRVLFSVFDKAGFHISALSADKAGGELIDDPRRVVQEMDGSATDTIAPKIPSKSAAILPSDGPGGQSAVSDYLADSDRGLPTDSIAT